MKTQFHFNLNTKLWSIKRGKNPIENCHAAILRGVDAMHPSPKNKQARGCILEGASRKVFAKYKADSVTPVEPSQALVPEGAERIWFNPKEGDKFFHVWREGSRFAAHSLSLVVATATETWGIVTKEEPYEDAVSRVWGGQ